MSSEAKKYGKKVKVLGVRTPAGSCASIDVRLDDEGVFAAEYLGVWHTSRDLRELTTTIEKIVRESGPSSWAYYIEIDEVEYGKKAFEWDHTKKAKIVLDYRIVKLSNEMKDTETGKLYRLYDAVDLRGGKLHDRGMPQVCRAGKDSLVPYTPERWATLEHIAATVKAVGEKLREFLNEGEETVAGFLDDASATKKLLPTVVTPVLVTLPRKGD